MGRFSCGISSIFDYVCLNKTTMKIERIFYSPQEPLGGASGPSNRPNKPIQFAPQISFHCDVRPEEETVFDASLTAVVSLLQELVPLIQNPKNLFAIYVTDDVRKTFDELMSHRQRSSGVTRIGDPNTPKLSSMSLCFFNNDPGKSTFIIAIDRSNLKSIPEACATLALEFGKIIINYEYRIAVKTVAEIPPIPDYDLYIKAYEKCFKVLNLLLESSRQRSHLKPFTDELARIIQRERIELDRWNRVKQAATS